ncbi:hypothetical protein SSX86_011057 [Deinandra increscens subsp. villosa]|uniref:Uncharacterized protein n=1 Tax=Deinandra increscens subsp. villosa TaxID=3103831 RepID=A0AAP0DCX8_9ASTR
MKKSKISTTDHRHRVQPATTVEKEDYGDEMDKREKVQCSEWGEHYNTTSSTSDDEEIDRESRSEMKSRCYFEHFNKATNYDEQVSEMLETWQSSTFPEFLTVKN